MAAQRCRAARSGSPGDRAIDEADPGTSRKKARRLPPERKPALGFDDECRVGESAIKRLLINISFAHRRARLGGGRDQEPQHPVGNIDWNEACHYMVELTPWRAVDGPTSLGGLIQARRQQDPCNVPVSAERCHQPPTALDGGTYVACGYLHADVVNKFPCAPPPSSLPFSGPWQCAPSCLPHSRFPSRPGPRQSLPAAGSPQLTWRSVLTRALKFPLQNH